MLIPQAKPPRDIPLTFGDNMASFFTFIRFFTQIIIFYPKFGTIIAYFAFRLLKTQTKAIICHHPTHDLNDLKL